MRIVLGAPLAALLLLAAGCGSLSSRWNGNYGPYVGVKLDIEQVTHYETEGEVIAAFDIPLSAIADTLFLPYDLSRPERKVADTASATASSSSLSEAPANSASNGRAGYR